LGDHTIGATFSLLGPFTIDASAGPGGSITPAGATTVSCGASRSYAIAPADKCHVIQDVVVDGTSQGAISRFDFPSVTADHGIRAVFSTIQYAIQASAAPGLTIDPGGTANVTCGSGQTFTIAAADPCHLIQDVQVDGASVGAVTSYTFRDVVSGHTITATSAPSIALHQAHRDASFTGRSDGSIDLTVAGGTPPYTYAWSNGAISQDVSSLAAGTYHVTVTDARNCTNELSVAIGDAGPAALALDRPFPNPTSGPLQFRYGFPAAAAVHLSILDLQGREVAVLTQGNQPPGWSWASWNGEIGSGRAPGGIYFVRLVVGGRQVVQRFALIR
jgi:hypothetical protein